MGVKTSDGLYCVKMYLNATEYAAWKAEQEASGCGESGYCRAMNLLPPRRPGAPLGNVNGRGRRGRKYPSSPPEQNGPRAKPDEPR